MAANPNPGSNTYLGNAIGPNKYGAAPNNSNREPLDEANGISTQDYTGRAVSATQANPNAGAASDIVSPTGVLTANAVALTIPPNAVTITIVITATFSFSEYGSAGAPLTQGCAWPANTPLTLEVARQQFLYVTGTTALNFFFQTL
jgi:hypothetical protein